MKTLKNPQYNPSALLDFAIEKLNLKSDAALSRALNIAPPQISKIRNKRLPIGASALVRIHEEIGVHVRELKAIAGMS